MSKRVQSPRDPDQLQLGFEPSKPNGKRWCATCQVWTDEALYHLFHGWGHPKRPYDRPDGG